MLLYLSYFTFLEPREPSTKMTNKLSIYFFSVNQKENTKKHVKCSVHVGSEAILHCHDCLLLICSIFGGIMIIFYCDRKLS